MLQRYVVVSPVKDEEQFVEHTLHSVVSQTLKPYRWVIVDDGSTDGTAAIVHRYAKRHPFICLVSNPQAGARRPGAAVIRAFDYGYSLVRSSGHEFVVKLDCDLSFPPAYFETLLGRFHRDRRLGIASGIYLELNAARRWKAVGMPAYHAFGASKVVRRTCFDEIGGFVQAPGWDTVDEIRASTKGWKTGHFEDLQAKHHKREGSGIGQCRTSMMHGQIYYATGGDPWFFALKVLRRVAVRPIIVGAVALLLGYVNAVVRKTPRLVTGLEARTYRRQLHGRLLGRPANTPALEPVSPPRPSR